MRTPTIVSLLILLMVAACSPTTTQVQVIPYSVAEETPDLDLISASEIADEFLVAWGENDYETMYGLLSFSSREATEYEQFEAAYEQAHDSMALLELSYAPNTMLRESKDVVALDYDLTFTTNLLGEFTDPQRQLHLVADSEANDWRIAWSLGDIFAEMGEGARLSYQSRIPARANIYDRDGNLLADQNGIMLRASLVKEDISDEPQCVQLLAQATDVPNEIIQNRIDIAGQTWTIEAGLVTADVYTAMHELLETICGVSFERQPTRRYLDGTLMPHILGSVGLPDEDEIEELIHSGFNQETIVGKSGIEQYWDETLRGKPGGRLSLISPLGNTLRVLAEFDGVPAQSVWLTIDTELQRYITELFNQAAPTWGAFNKGAAAVVMNVNTGEILASVSYPTFEGNALTSFPIIGRDAADQILQSLADDTRVPQLNRVTQAALPAGSTFKVVPAMAVADSGTYNDSYAYYCSGVWQVGNDRRVDWLTGGHGRMTVTTALTHSCNPFFYEAGYQLNLVDSDLLPSYAKKMGLGAPTGIQDVAEASGFIPDPEWLRRTLGEPWTFSHSVTMSIGQGEVAVTPLQMARMYAGIANGGNLLRPQLVREVGILNTREVVAEPDVMETWDFSPETMEKIRSGLCNVTVGYGTASHIFITAPELQETIGVCGKTGTAQSGADTDPPHAWFVGWAPNPNPEIVVAVVVEKAGEGSAVAAPLVRDIMDFYYFGREQSSVSTP